jgi:hypothetical protein
MEAKVDARLAGWGVSDVHAMPKLAMDRYMYLAGLVKDKVGVTWNQIYVRIAGDTCAQSSNTWRNTFVPKYFPTLSFCLGYLFRWISEVGYCSGCAAL